MSTALDVTVFRTVLATQLGWMFNDNDVPQLAQVLRDRVETARLHPGAYLRRLARGDWDAELGALAEDLTINETYFFRHGEQFRALAEVVLPERLRDRYAQRMLRLLSVGCSSGEEAYTLAIVAREAQPDPDWIPDVLGLDASAAMLEQAARARYSGWALRETPDAVRARWFRPEDGEYVLDPAIRASVRFRRYNVATEDEQLWHAGQYDVIFCRNLLMYLTPDVRESLIGRMTRSLAPGGCLFLGHTDTLGSRPEGLEPQQSHQAFYYRRAPSAAALAAQVPRLRPPARHEATRYEATRYEATRYEATRYEATRQEATRHEAARQEAREMPRAAPAAPGDAYGRAMGLLRDERFEEALTAVEAALGARPAPRDLLLHGVLLAQAGRFEEAEIVCRRLLDVDGLYADAHHQLAVCLEGGAAVDVAIGHYRLAAYLDPGFAMPRLRLGLLARRRGEIRTARTELERALALLKQEREERLTLFGGGFGRIALTSLCRAELDSQVSR